MDERFERDRFGRRYDDERGFGAGREPDRSRHRDEPNHAGGRGFLDRAGDEVRSWFGDPEAERRRRQDERERRDADRESGRRGDGDGPEYPDYGYDRRAGGEWRDERVFRESPPPPESGPWRERSAGEEPPWNRGGPREVDWPASRGYGVRERDPRGAGEARITRGRYTGRGPKGYRRSDPRIQEDVCEGLSEHGDIDATEIEVSVVDREVTLQGSVASRWEKRLAEDIAESVSGVREVHNHLRVSQDLFGRRAG